MPPRRRKALSAAERKAATDRQWLSRIRLRLQRQNASAPAAPPINPAAASAAADSPSATGYDSALSPANGSGAQLPIGPAMVSTPVPMTEHCLHQFRHAARR